MEVNNVIQILLVDDLNLVRLGIKEIISRIPGMHVVAEANRGEEGVRLAKDIKPDVVIMDINMPGIGGLEATRRIHHYEPHIKILIVTVQVQEPYPTRMLQAGAAGYITKNASGDELAKAIHTINKGERYLSPEVAQALALRHVTETGNTPFETLTERELQVMMMITQGIKIQDISDTLCLSPKTVCSYRYRIFEKLSIDTDVALTHMALRYGMIDLMKI